DRVNAAHTLTRQSASLSVISRPESTQHTRELSALDCIGRVGDLSLRFEMTGERGRLPTGQSDIDNSLSVITTAARDGLCLTRAALRMTDQDSSASLAGPRYFSNQPTRRWSRSSSKGRSWKAWPWRG